MRGGCSQQLRLGVPMGLSPAADLLGFAIFQMMQTRLGTAGGAATQMVVILTSLAYMPGFGIASAGTTLVGQSIGAGARDWALRVGNRTILLAALYMGGIGRPDRARADAGCCRSSPARTMRTRSPRWRSARSCCGWPPATSSSTA